MGYLLVLIGLGIGAFVVYAGMNPEGAKSLLNAIGITLGSDKKTRTRFFQWRHYNHRTGDEDEITFLSTKEPGSSIQRRLNYRSTDNDHYKLN